MTASRIVVVKLRMPWSLNILRTAEVNMNLQRMIAKMNIVLPGQKVSISRKAYMMELYKLVKESQMTFQNSSLERDLKTIHDNYIGLHAVIIRLENTVLPLAQSLQIVDDVNTLLQL
ncbi:hypothetical protein NQ318_017145 [Aromia moschata]|uniref:Uncharacterized protein n=1 Tax=Aromia moschata TaxID=1265417 RepID=A0AAV8Y2A4_9CUCU|nr:hypothetical protein NQ318_017145 [Aromia moschata]